MGTLFYAPSDSSSLGSDWSVTVDTFDSPFDYQLLSITMYWEHFMINDNAGWSVLEWWFLETRSLVETRAETVWDRHDEFGLLWVYQFQPISVQFELRWDLVSQHSDHPTPFSVFYCMLFSVKYGLRGRFCVWKSLLLEITLPVFDRKI